MSIDLCVPALWLFTPWLWVCLELSPSGGFWMEIYNPKKIGFFGPVLMFQCGAIGRESWQWFDER